MNPLDILSLVIILPAALVVAAMLGLSFGNRSREAIAPPGNAAPDNENLELAVRGLLRASRSNKVRAIKIVRERTGMGLKEAKEYVDALAAGVNAQHALAARARDGEWPYAGAADAVRAIRAARGGKIAAIKRVREMTGMGLKDAKAFVDSIWA